MSFYISILIITILIVDLRINKKQNKMAFKNEIDRPFFLKRWYDNFKDTTHLVIRDILNYLFIRRTINIYKNTVEWKELNLRYTYSGILYTVVNLRAEDFGEKDPEVRELRYRERSERLYQYITQLNLHEVLSPEITYQPGTYSYLVQFIPIFRILTLKWIIFSLIKMLCLYFFVIFLNSIFNFNFFFQQLYNFLHGHNILK